MPAGSTSVAATFAANGLFFISIMILFEYYRNRVTDIYAPRSRGLQPKSVKPRSGVLQWLFQIHELSDDDMFRIAGMDGYVFLRFLKFCCKVCTITSLVALSVLIPVYYTSPGNKDAYGIDLISMANIKPGADRLWFSFICAYFFTLIFLYLIHQEYRNFVLALRKFYDGEDDVIPEQVHYTIQVENIPPEFRTPDKLQDFFEALFPKEVLHAHVAISTPVLDLTIRKRDAARNQLERAIASYEASGRHERPTLYLRHIKRSLAAASSGKDVEVDAMIYLTGRLGRLAERIERLQNEYSREMEKSNASVHRTSADSESQSRIATIRADASHAEEVVEEKEEESAQLLKPAFDKPQQQQEEEGEQSTSFFEDVKQRLVGNLVSATGFVTFRSRRAQVSAVRMPILSDRYPKMKAIPGPSPSDVIWANMSASQRHTEDVAHLSATTYYVGLLFWSVIMAFVAALSNVSTLEKYIPFMKSINDYVYAFLQGILPVLVLMTFSIIMASTIGFIAQELEKRKTHSAVDQEVFKWYFMYQIANIYLLLFAGSIWDSLAQALENPKAIVSLISAALPTVSVFFINFIITSWLSGVPYKLIRRYFALQYLYYRTWFSDALLIRRTMKDGPFEEARVNYGPELSDVLYVLCVVLLYWIIAPLVVVLATALFWSWYYAWKYHYVFVVTRTFESGGKFWYKIYRYSMTGLMAGAVTFMAYMGIKEGISQGPLLLPLPLIILYSWRYTEKRFKEKSKNLAFGTALDRERTLLSEENGFGNVRAKGLQQESKSALMYDKVGITSNGGDSASGVLEFSPTFMVQPNLLSPPKVYPYPYRIDGVPLLDHDGKLSAVYVENIPDGVDPSVLFPNTNIPDYSVISASDRKQSEHHDRATAANLHCPLDIDGIGLDDNVSEREILLQNQL